MLVTCAVEGIPDEAVVRRLLAEVGLEVGPVLGRKGKPHLLREIARFNASARELPWLVVVDLDNDAECAPEAMARWLPRPEQGMHLRVAIRSIEAWLLADRSRIAAFLDVDPSQVPYHPEALPNPKKTLLDLARRSRSRETRDGLVPRPASGRDVGAGYNSLMTEFALTRWRPTEAARCSDSLARCRKRLAELVRSPR